jgi:hypothetical protein
MWEGRGFLLHVLQGDRDDNLSHEKTSRDQKKERRWFYKKCINTMHDGEIRPIIFPALSPRSSDLLFPHAFSGMKRETGMYDYSTQRHVSESTLLSKILSLCPERKDMNSNRRHGILKILSQIPISEHMTEILQLLQIMTGTCSCRFKLLQD